MNTILPHEIERQSMEIIGRELGPVNLGAEELTVLKRVIHTTADFEYAQNLMFSPNAVQLGMEALKRGATVITDTQMVAAGINKKAAGDLGVQIHCFISDEDVARRAKARGSTRAVASMEKAAEMPGEHIYAIGNAPTALLYLLEMIGKGEMAAPALIVGVPVGFVNVVESKELLLEAPLPYIVARGRKGGSPVAAAIVNAMLYMARDGAGR